MFRNKLFPLNIVTLEDCEDVEALILGMRKTFSQVFSRHYAEIIFNAAAQSGNPKAEIILEGFEDVISKYFPRDIKQYQKSEIISILEKLYFGVGFDEEAAFIRVFAGINTPGRILKQSEADQTEALMYMQLLEKEKRNLKEVNFIALADEGRRVRGFCIYNIFKQAGNEIIHVRQAAMLDRNRGYANLMACYLADKYPHVYYEANQRKVNSVPIKKTLISERLLEEMNPVLGYGMLFTGLQSPFTLKELLLKHFEMSPSVGRHLLKMKGYGKYAEMEDIPG